MNQKLTLWNTEAVRKLIEPIPSIEKIEVGPEGSEITTEQLIISIKGCEDKVYVRGFTDNLDRDGGLPSYNNVEIPMVEVTTEYSDGEDSPEPENMRARTEIMVALKQAGFTVVRSLSPYF